MDGNGTGTGTGTCTSTSTMLTSSRYGYCWIEPRIDWERLTFHSSITDKMLFGNNVLKGQYLKRGGQAMDFFSINRRLEIALEWFERYHHLPEIQNQLLSWMTHICLQQFRVDVLQHMKKEILAEYHDSLAGNDPFCWDYLTTITGSNLHLVSGKRPCQTPSEHASFLFDFDDGRKRLSWENKPFRKLYQSARTRLSLTHGEQMGKKFSQQMWQNLFRHHWILPHPSSDRWVNKSRGGRPWYSIEKGEVTNLTNQTNQRRSRSRRVRRMAEREVEEGEGDAINDGWKWAQKSYQEGYPEGFPGYVSWTNKEWENWLLRGGAEVEGAEVVAEAEGADSEAGDVEGEDSEAGDVEGADSEAGDVEGADSEAADVEAADFEGAEVEAAEFEEADFERADFDDEALARAQSHLLRLFLSRESSVSASASASGNARASARASVSGNARASARARARASVSASARASPSASARASSVSSVKSGRQFMGVFPRRNTTLNSQSST
jgi:hypothetical protein